MMGPGHVHHKALPGKADGPLPRSAWNCAPRRPESAVGTGKTCVSLYRARGEREWMGGGGGGGVVWTPSASAVEHSGDGFPGHHAHAQAAQAEPRLFSCRGLPDAAQ